MILWGVLEHKLHLRVGPASRPVVHTFIHWLRATPGLCEVRALLALCQCRTPLGKDKYQKRVVGTNLWNQSTPKQEGGHAETVMEYKGLGKA